MIQQLHDAPNCREAEPQAARAIARRVVQLIELFEDALVLFLGDADPGVPDLDAGDAAAPAATDHDAAAVRVADRIRDQVRQHAKQQRRIGREHRLRARAPTA